MAVMTRNLTECDMCGTEVENHKLRRSHDPDEGRLCRECFTSTHVKCDKCGHLAHHSFTTETYRGEIHCFDGCAR